MNYFPIAPIGVGTSEVECLSSFMRRFAAGHGVSHYQLVRHLQYRWQHEYDRHLPRCDELKWDGYSKNVGLALSALKDCTGLRLADCTLIALSGVCSGNHVGCIKHVRTWCPRCYTEDLASAHAPYDRLVWRIQGYDRCSTHRHRLLDRCPRCNSQLRSDKCYVEPHLCSFCHFDLSKGSRRSHFAPRPSRGEPQLEELVANLGALGKIRKRSPLRQFFRYAKLDEDALPKELGELFHQRNRLVVPQLSSLVAFSSYFNISLVDLIANPRAAAQQARLDIQGALPDRRHKKVIVGRLERAAWFKAELERELKARPPYVSLAEFCRSRNYTLSGAQQCFGLLTAKIARRYRAWRCASREEMRKRVDLAIRKRKRILATMPIKAAVAVIANECGAPIHVVRAALGSFRELH